MFIGQGHITAQLKFILPSTYELRGVNFLFRGPSGYGKTELAMRVANYYADTRYIMRLGNDINFEEDKSVHLYDEIHLCPVFENWYPIMDKKKYILIFTTNSDANLPEAFVRRCYDYIFTDYSNEELIQIVRMKSALDIKDEQILYIINSSHKSPAIILNKIKVLSMWRTSNPSLQRMSLEEFKELMQTLFGIVDGIDPLQRRYIEVLQKFGGRSSVTNIQNALHVPLDTIKRDVEPSLLDKGLIQITSKGRSLV